MLIAAILLALFEHVSARAPQAPSTDFIATSEAGHLGSQMIGLEVYNNNDQDLARIEDISVSQDGQVQAFVLSIGEDLGLFARFVAVKPSALRIESSKGGRVFQARMDATADQLRSAPRYRYTGTKRACLNVLRF